MTMISSPIARTRRLGATVDYDGITQRVAILVLALLMGILVVTPLVVMGFRSVTNENGAFVGIGNFVRYFSNSALLGSLVNTFILGTVTMTATVLLAFPFAYAVTCSRMIGRSVFFVLCMLPLYAPTMLYGIGLYCLFGNQGLVTTGGFGRSSLHLDIDIHGLTGIIFAEVLAAFPPVMLILVVSLSHRDRRLYEAAESMGASPLRMFTAITLPSCRVGLLSAAAVAFVLSTTDYGAPEMLAEKTNVLALDIAVKAMGIGQKSDHALGAVISLVLLLPTCIASLVQLAMRKKQSAALTARSVPMIPDSNPGRDGVLFAYCLLITAAIVIVTLTTVLLSLSTSWPYSLYPMNGVSMHAGDTFTFANFNFDQIGEATGGGINAYWNSLSIAGLTAVVGTSVSFIAAYLIEKSRVFPRLRRLARTVAIIPLGLPGMVLGLSFVLIFNPLRWGPLANPLAPLYGTMAILVICNVVHYFGVSFLTASAAVAQLDEEFEQVAASMAVSTWRLLVRVTVPICLPAILEIAIYYFVSAMTTVSAVIFLASAKNPLASVAIVNLKDSGNLEAAAAMAVLILLSNVVLRIAVEPVMRYFRNRTQHWRAV